MDKINADGGFLAGLFGGMQRSTTRSSRRSLNRFEPKPHDFWKIMPEGVGNELLAMSGEFVGTFMFLFFAFAGTQVANTNTSNTGDTAISTGPNTSVLLYISLCFGFSLAVNAWIFFRVTGGLFNPAVTLGLCLIGAVPFKRGALVFIAQMFGGMASAGVVSAILPGPLAVTTTLSAGTNTAQGLFLEMFLTAGLVFTIFMLAAEKHKSTFLAPVGIGLALFIAELAGVYYTGGSLNPARSFGPCVATRSFPHYHWIYWLGPCLGALVAAGFFWFIKSCEYETVNPGQDFDDLEAEAYDPEKDITRPVVSPNAVVETNVNGRTGEVDHRMDELINGNQPYKQNPNRYQEEPAHKHPQTYQSPQQQSHTYGQPRQQTQTYEQPQTHQQSQRYEQSQGQARGYEQTPGASRNPVPAQYTTQAPAGRSSQDRRRPAETLTKYY